MKTEKIAQALRNRLENELPGWQAQCQMATRVHREARVKPPDVTRKAGVMLLLYPDAGQLWMPLIKRTTYRGVHSDQMALPGGKIDPEDQDITETALRETREEIGVSVARDQVLGILSDLYIPPSNIMVTPVVAMISHKPSYQPEPSEVADTFDISLEDLQNQEHRSELEVARFNDTPLEAPAFVIRERIIWGATAMMLSEFLHIIQELD